MKTTSNAARPLGGWIARLFFVFIAAPSSVANAIPYSYESLYDRTDIGFPGHAPPSLNDFGQVAFQALQGSQELIVKGDGGPLTVIAGQGNTYAAFSPYPAINNVGQVVFNAARVQDNEAIFVGDGVAPAVNITGPLTGSFVNGLGLASINNLGQVAFRANDGNDLNTYFWDGTSRVLVTETADSSIDIDDSTTLAFVIGDDVVKWQAGTLTPIANTGSQFTDFLAPPSINEHGDVVFHGRLVGGGSAVVLYEAATQDTSTVVSTADGFTAVGFEPGINNAGSVIFDVNTNTGSSVFIATNTVPGAVLSTGMPLFGSTLVQYQFYRHGFNNLGQLAFRYQLSNGNIGIGLATPVPEPSAFLLATLGGLGLILVHRFRSQRQELSKASST